MNDSHTPQSQDNTAQHESERHNSGSGVVDIPSGLTADPSPRNKHANADNHEKPFWKKLDSYRFIAELAILLVTIRIACIYSGQLKQMIESNRINRDSLYTVQRAFIVYDGVEHDIVNAVIGVQKIVPLGKAFRFYAKWENSGNTPAIEVVQGFGVAGRQPGKVSEESFLLEGQENEPQFSTSFAGPRTPVTSRIHYMPASFANVSESERYFFGWTYYRDTFPNTKPHVTEFCEHIDTVETAPHDAYRFTLSQCSEHNCVDEFCADYDAIIKRVQSNLKSKH
jgi:hypothetical protein